MKWNDQLPEDWEDAPDDPPHEEPQPVKLEKLHSGWVVRPVDAGAGASSVAVYSTVSINAEPAQ